MNATVSPCGGPRREGKEAQPGGGFGGVYRTTGWEPAFHCEAATNSASLDSIKKSSGSGTKAAGSNPGSSSYQQCDIGKITSPL